MARRNLTSSQMSYLRGRLRKLVGRKKAAELTNVSEAQITRDSKFVDDVDRVSKDEPELRNDIMARKVPASEITKDATTETVKAAVKKGHQNRVRKAEAITVLQRAERCRENLQRAIRQLELLRAELPDDGHIAHLHKKCTSIFEEIGKWQPSQNGTSSSNGDLTSSEPTPDTREVVL